MLINLSSLTLDVQHYCEWLHVVFSALLILITSLIIFTINIFIINNFYLLLISLFYMHVCMCVQASSKCWW